MGSLTCQGMRDLEEQAFRRGICAESLMDLAGRGIAEALIRRYPKVGYAVACIGSGNNGGDALVALKYLARAGWQVGVRCLHEPSQVGALPRKKWRELGALGALAEGEGGCQSGQPFLILDGLLGLGAKGPLRTPLDELAAWMNHMRRCRGAVVVAMDLPSGVDGDTGEAQEGAVVADVTLTVGVAKRGLLSEAAENHVGVMESVPLDDLPVPEDLSPCLIDRSALSDCLPRRPHRFHKGDAGRVGIVAGSVGMLGAAVLCARGALRSGAGLVTVFVYEEVYPLLAPMMPPEVMVQPVKSLQAIRGCDLDAMVMGPGMGSSNQQENRRWLALLRQLEMPMVLDADALNRLAQVSLVKYLRACHVLTPHPGEMARLFPEGAHWDREKKVKAFVERYPGTTLLLKGAHSVIARDDQALHINGSGHAGMASGGQGDVLAGVIGGLMAQNVPPFEAARLGAWLCGRAAELALSHGHQSVHSVLPSDVLDCLGLAFRDLP
ncbi:NAD(P)H-hydrate dehydratase [Verrucomicrobiaceae bacterium N1E253]|uniref:Bifunctional NAD(P)H-hydrate repair enzyme n=1 Tax=Oceaniferula marina TaxID=2748318 RepID=A0A851GQS0_9BACT|nr:NAD(P)H-hydrate dehydratase [Oceaniferula marina]NWK57337.1 NAD(P)H-hydrate dehydratase [Oceaniferula marina]